MSFFFLFCTALSSAVVSPTLDETSTPLLNLLELLHAPHDGTLKDIVNVTQKQWLQIGKERWQFTPIEQEKMAQAFPLLQQIGCIDAIYPSKSSYHYAIILGGTYKRMQARIQHLLSEWEKGLRVKEIVLLSGERLLDQLIEVAALEHETEAKLLRHLWDAMTANTELQHLPVHLVNAPGRWTPEGKWQRPNRKDTWNAWLGSTLLPASCVVVSNQPFVGYDRAVIKTSVPTSFITEVIGAEADRSLPLAVYLDNLARWLYTEEQHKSGQP